MSKWGTVHWLTEWRHGRHWGVHHWPLHYPHSWSAYRKWAPTVCSQYSNRQQHDTDNSTSFACGPSPYLWSFVVVADTHSQSTRTVNRYVRSLVDLALFLSISLIFNRNNKSVKAFYHHRCSSYCVLKWQVVWASRRLWRDEKREKAQTFKQKKEKEKRKEWGAVDGRFNANATMLFTAKSE